MCSHRVIQHIKKALLSFIFLFRILSTMDPNFCTYSTQGSVSAEFNKIQFIYNYTYYIDV